MNIFGKVAIVTGGCQGIGKGIVYALLKKGAKVAVLDINDAKGEALQETFNHEFGESRTVYKHCDVADKKQLEDVFKSIKSRFNEVNIVVNNAGVEEMQWEKVIDINLKAVVSGTLLGLEMMDKKCGNNGGVVINMSSMAGFVPLSMSPMYSTTKAGVIAFTRCFKAAARNNGVRVNCICPSFVESDMLERGKSKYPGFEKVVDEVGVMPVSMVVDAVMQTIENDSLAGNVILVTKNAGIQKYTFPMAKI